MLYVADVTNAPAHWTLYPRVRFGHTLDANAAKRMTTRQQLGIAETLETDGTITKVINARRHVF